MFVLSTSFLHSILKGDQFEAYNLRLKWRRPEWMIVAVLRGLESHQLGMLDLGLEPEVVRAA